MKNLCKTWNILIVLLLPIVAVCLSANLVTRLPDVYQYSFKSTEQLQTAPLRVGSDEFGDLISGYMIGKNVDMRVGQGEETEEKYEFFTKNDMEILRSVRFRLNIILILGIVALGALVGAFAACKGIDDGERAARAIKQAQLSALVVFFAMIIFFSVSLAMGFPIWENGILSEGSENFRLVVTLALLKHLYIAWMIATAALEGIMLYAARQLTKPKLMFSRGNY